MLEVRQRLSSTGGREVFETVHDDSLLQAVYTRSGKLSLNGGFVPIHVVREFLYKVLCEVEKHES